MSQAETESDRLEFDIRVIDEDAAAADQQAAALVDELVALEADVKIGRKKDEADTQDIGSILEIVLCAPAVMVLAHGIASFIRRSRSCTLEIKHGDRTAVIRGARPQDAAEVARILRDL